jgi:hypothetical protein
MIRKVSVREIALLLTVAIPLAIGALIAHRAVDIPYWDEWETADLVYRMHIGTLQFSDLWAQHNEHRMLFPNLITLGLAWFGGWDPVREQFFSLGILVLTQLLIVTMVRRVAHGAVGIYAALAASIVLYGLWQYENFGWGFQLAWFICNACAVAVVVLLTRPFRRPIHVVIAMAVAFIGSYSSSQGLIVWAVGAVAIALSLRAWRPTLAVWIPAGALAFWIYQRGLLPEDYGHVNVLAHPITAVRYVLAYLGSPLGAYLGSNGSAVFGVLLIALLTLLFVADVRSARRVRGLMRNAGWYGLAVYPLLCALATSTGRGGFGVDQSLASRYTAISGLAWIAVIGLLASRLSRWRQPFGARRAEAILAVSVAFGFVVGASNLWSWDNWKVSAGNLVAAKIELEHNDPAALAKIYPNREHVVMLMGELRSVHDGIYIRR